MEKKFVVDVEGVPMAIVFSEKCFRSALNYKAKPGEIYIATYPKCGTTWMQQIILLILRRGELSEDPLDYFLGCPFIDMIGADYVEISNSKSIKTHLPYYAVPYSDEAKYIYVARNPKDCCVSFYYHMKLLSLKSMDFSFDQIFNIFLKGEMGYGDYFDHLLGWYQHRKDKNVYFVTYEDLHKDIRGEIMKISKFMGDEYEKCILEDPNILEKIVYYSSFEFMKKDINKAMEMLLNDDEVFTQRGLPAGLIEAAKTMKENTKKGGSGAFVRKGIVGDWKNLFNENQVKLLDEKAAEKTKNSDVMKLWEGI